MLNMLKDAAYRGGDVSDGNNEIKLVSFRRWEGELYGVVIFFGG